MTLKSKYHKVTMFYILFVGLLILFSLNFASKGTYFFALLCFVTVCKSMISPDQFHLTIESIILLTFCVIYYLTYGLYFAADGSHFVYFFIGPFLAYCIGYFVIKKESQSIYFIILFVLTYFFHGMLNILPYLQNGIQGDRVITDIWTNSLIAATLQGTFFTMCVSLLFYGVILHKNIFVKVFFLALCSFSVFATLLTATRTLIYLIFICLLGNSILYLWLNKKYCQKILKFIAIGLIIIAILICAYSLDLFEIKTAIQASPLYERMDNAGIKEDPRISMYFYVLRYLLAYPFGGRTPNAPLVFGNSPKPQAPLAFAHNLWLDVAYTTGVVPFILLIIFTGLTLITLVRLLKKTTIHFHTKHVVFSIYLAIYLNFMVEPILEAAPQLFLIMCFINGMTRKLCDMPPHPLAYINVEKNRIMSSRHKSLKVE